MRRAFALVVVLAIVLTIGFAPQARASTSEFRAFWVDAFGEGIFNDAEATKLVNAAKAANVNALVVQIGRRGDCFCNRASMPRTQAGIAPRPYDPLDAIIAKAHAAGIQVHAWIITTALWNSSVAPLDPSHAFNQHGPSKTGYDNWLGVRYDGALRESPSSAANWFFDPGHPDAANYIAEMYLSVARNYAIDGLNFDRVRYPDLPLAAWPADNAWGYNPVALDRFQAATGRVDRPLPNDPQWSQWRRDQVTNIVRKVYVEARDQAVPPHQCRHHHIRRRPSELRRRLDPDAALPRNAPGLARLDGGGDPRHEHPHELQAGALHRHRAGLLRRPASVVHELERIREGQSVRALHNDRRGHLSQHGRRLRDPGAQSASAERRGEHCDRLGRLFVPDAGLPHQFLVQSATALPLPLG